MPSKINVNREVDDMEEVLRSTADQGRRAPLIAVLRRWQHDDMLDAASREKAARLVKEFGKRVRAPIL